MTLSRGNETKLFDVPTHLSNGLVYRPDFITPGEETTVLKTIQALPLEHATFETYTAKRRIAGFGWGYDFEKKRFIPGPPLPPFLAGIQRKIAKWLDIPARSVVEALVTEYPPGASIGWHRDTEEFEHIVGISLLGWCRMRFRPVLSWSNGPLGGTRTKKDLIALELEPRSAYIMQGPVRWRWQHSLAPTKTLRYSITFRTLSPHIKPLRLLRQRS